MGFVKYNGMTAEQFVWAWIKSEFLMPKKLMFQSQSERDKTVAGNEGGSVRPTVGVELPWRQFAADRLATSHSVSGRRGQIETLLS